MGASVDVALAGVGLGDRMQQPVEGLSGGERGRLGLATLLLENPDVLLLDEPTNHLDIAGREWLENFLSEIAWNCFGGESRPSIA